MGLNAVRIPLPWYAFGAQNEHESYISCIDYIDRAMEWANKYEMKVLLDLATVPGGQGDSNSSPTIPDIVADWHSSANGRATALETLALPSGTASKSPCLASSCSILPL